MRRIPLPDADDKTVFDNIAAAKLQPRKKHLQAARTTVFSAYQNYKDAVPEVGDLPNVVLTADQRDALIHAFEVKTAPMADLRTDLLNRINVARCPFCSLSESSTLDHYLPKELSPQFAIFPKNLVPCCPICNSRKRDKIRDNKTNIRLFLHPYFDDIPQMLFIRVAIKLLPSAMNLRYSLVKPASMALATFKHLKLHFEHLGLADRYRRMALDDLRGLYASLVRMYGNSKDADRIAAALIEKAKEFEDAHGKNHWLTILYYTLAQNKKFCNGGFYVLNQIQ